MAVITGKHAHLVATQDQNPATHIAQAVIQAATLVVTQEPM